MNCSLRADGSTFQCSGYFNVNRAQGAAVRTTIDFRNDARCYANSVYLFRDTTLSFDNSVLAKNSSRDQAIVGEFMQLALENYRTEHKISFYAHEASLTLSHFCNVISKTTGMTAQHIIMNLIIMDAKNQLRNSDAPVQEIAKILGFSSPTTFNRYFKTYTGFTPQEYRNNEEN